MKFLVDAHLPRKLAIQLKEAGYDTRHALGLPTALSSSDHDSSGYENEIKLGAANCDGRGTAVV